MKESTNHKNVHVIYVNKKGYTFNILKESL